MTDLVTFVTFLRARLDQDERKLGDCLGYCDGGVHLDDARWAAEIAAKRAILDIAISLTESGYPTAGHRIMVRLAEPYADHPDHPDRTG